MMINRFHETLDAFSDIVKAIEDLEIVQKETVSKLKAKLRLFDGSILWVREVHVNGLMEVYSYYWLRPGTNDKRLGSGHANMLLFILIRLKFTLKMWLYCHFWV